MSSVLEYFREKDARFKDVSDDDLTRYVAERHPEFLNEPDFEKQAFKIAPDSVRAGWQGLPQASMYATTPRSILSRGYEAVREAVSPLLGPTEEQKKREAIEWGGKRVYKPLGGDVEQSGFVPALSKPTVTTPKFDTSKTTSWLPAIGKGAANIGLGFIDFATSPLGAATMMVGGPAAGAGVRGAEAAALPQAVTAGYGIDMSLKAPEAIGEAWRVAHDPNATLGQKVEAGIGAGTTALLGAGLTAKGIKGPVIRTPITPEGAATLLNTAAKKTGANIKWVESDEPFVSKIDSTTGEVILNSKMTDRWLSRVPDKERPAAIKSLLAEEQIHLGVRQMPEGDALATQYWNTLTAAEKKIAERIYTGEWKRPEGVSEQQMAHDALRFRLQQLARMTPREVAEAVGRERWTVQSLDTVGRSIQKLRETIGTKAGKEGSALLDRLADNFEQAQAASLAMQDANAPERQEYRQKLAEQIAQRRKEQRDWQGLTTAESTDKAFTLVDRAIAEARFTGQIGKTPQQIIPVTRPRARVQDIPAVHSETLPQKVPVTIPGFLRSAEDKLAFRDQPVIEEGQAPAEPVAPPAEPAAVAPEPAPLPENPTVPAPEEQVAGKVEIEKKPATISKGSIEIKIVNPYGLAPENEKILTVTAKPVKIDSAPAEFEYVAYKRGNMWKVVEKSTGMSFGNDSQKTLKAAIESANKSAATVKPEVFRHAVNSSTKLNEQPAAAAAQPIYRGEGKNLGFTAVPDVEWWSENRGIAEQYGTVKEATIKPDAKTLRLRSGDKFSKAGYDELTRIAKKYGLPFNRKNAESVSGEELLGSGEVFLTADHSESAPTFGGKELMDAVRKEGYQVVHTDNIEGEATMILDKSAIQEKGQQDASKISPPAEVHGDVRPLEEPAKALPLEEGGKGVQPSPVPKTGQEGNVVDAGKISAAKTEIETMRRAATERIADRLARLKVRKGMTMATRAWLENEVNRDRGIIAEADRIIRQNDVEEMMKYVPRETEQPSPAAAKMPWEMTRDEYANSQKVALPDDFSALDAIEKRNNRRPYVPDAITDDSTQRLKSKGYISGTKNFKLTETGRSFLDDARRIQRENELTAGNLSDAHVDLVEQALREGKPVPKEVLAEYPELGKKEGGLGVPPIAKELISTVAKAGAEFTQRISNVKLAPYVEGQKFETITFELDGKQYRAELKGRNKDLVVGASPEIDKGIASRAYLDGDAIEVGKKQPAAVKGLSPTESSRLAELTQKVEAGQKLTAAEKARYQALRTKAAGEEPMAYAKFVQKAERRQKALATMFRSMPNRRVMDQFADGLMTTIPNEKGQNALKSLQIGASPLDLEAATAIVVSKFDPAQLAILKGLSARLPNVVKQVEHAERNYARLEPLAQRVKLALDTEFAEEAANGIDVDYFEGYMPGKYDRDMLMGAGRPYVLGGRSGRSTGFKKGKTFESPYHAIAASDKFVPQSLNAAELVENRIRSGQTLIGKKQWANALSAFHDPTDGLAITTPVKHVRNRLSGKMEEKVPTGYVIREIIPGTRIGVHEEYSRLFKALAGEESFISGGAPGSMLLELGGLIKHGLLMFDTFHAGRMMMREFFLTGKVSYNKGRTLLEYADADLSRAVNEGLITLDMANWVRANRPTAQLLVRNGLNVGRIQEALYTGIVRKIPVLGTFNKWVFEKLTRGALMEAGLIEFERVSKARPGVPPDVIARTVARDLNAYFGNLGRQGLFKSRAAQDVAQLVMLAPNWVESMARTEIKGFTQGVKGVTFDPVMHRTLLVGTIGKGMAQGLAASFVAAQIINLITRGKPTWENDEPGHKLNAFIPDATGKGQGFFISPFGVQAELFHDLLRYSQNEGNVLDAAARIASNKSSPFMRATKVMLQGKDWDQQKIVGAWDRIKQSAFALVPTPIPASSLMRKNAPSGSLQKQLTASLGLKTEFAPTPAQQLRVLKMDWMKNSDDPKVQHEYERQQKEELAQSDYRLMRQALRQGDLATAREEYLKLVPLKKNSRMSGPRTIAEAMQPRNITGLSKENELKFVRSLTPQQKRIYEAAKQERMDLYRRFIEMVRSIPSSRTR